jgi:uroporphyrinogen decarboxylase
MLLEDIYMTSRERILAAIGRRPADRAPMDFGGTLMSVCLPEFLEDMRRELGYALPPDRDADGTWVDERIQRYLDVDLRLVPGNIPQAALKEIDHDEYLRREKTRKYVRMADRSIITHSVRTEFPLRGLSYEEIRDGYREKTPATPPDSHIDWYIATARRYRGDGFATTFWVSSGVFEVGCWQRGYDEMCVDMLINTDVARLIFERVMEARLAWINAIVPPLADYIDIFCFGDDLALQTGPFMSPATFRGVVMPYLAPMYALMRRLAPNSHIFHHSCGSVYKLIPMLAEMGVGVLNPTQISAVDMSTEKLKGYGGVCYHGGIDLQDVLPNYSPGEVKRETERVIGALSPAYICAPCHSLPEDVPVANILAMFSADRSPK